MSSQRDSERSWICRIAREAVNAFEQHGLPCCLLGSAAANLRYCKSHGRDYYRVPNDVDLAVMSASKDAVGMKRLLVENGTGFTLEDAWDSTKTYKIVWYNAAPPLVDKARRWKIDILVPGDLNIPLIPKARLARLSMCLPDATYTLPCMPLLPLLILKLQAWYSIRNDKQRKDLLKLLKLAVWSGVRPDSFADLPESFAQKAYEWAFDFVCHYPDSQRQWAKVGFMQRRVMYKPETSVAYGFDR